MCEREVKFSCPLNLATILLWHILPGLRALIYLDSGFVVLDHQLKKRVERPLAAYTSRDPFFQLNVLRPPIFVKFLTSEPDHLFGVPLNLLE